MFQISDQKWKYDEESTREQSSPQSVRCQMPPIDLWPPNVVGGIAFFFGFPAGIVLASINWLRMGLTGKAISHLAKGTIGALMFPFLMISMPGTMRSMVGLFVSIGMLYYLKYQTKNDIEDFELSHRVNTASGSAAFLIGLVMLGLFVGLFFAAFALMAPPS